MTAAVTVAIPVRDGGDTLAAVLRALAHQTIAHELLICDSGSTDGSRELAEAHGARVITIPAESFSHGGTRNLLIGEAQGSHVALLSQDAEPAGETWLEEMLKAFELADDVAITYGPYRPRPDASDPVRVELERWYRSLSPDGATRIDRLAPEERSLAPVKLLGARSFFTDANACISRAAWERVPFRTVPYAEDHMLAGDMLRAGFAKAYVPSAAVIHSHDYSSWRLVQRCFDEWRGLLEVYGWREPADPAYLLRRLRGELGALRDQLRSEGAESPRIHAALIRAGRHHVLRLTGAVLGSRADLLPPRTRRLLSLERRASFEPVHVEQPKASPERKDLL